MKARIPILVAFFLVIVGLAGFFPSHAQKAEGQSAQIETANGAPPLSNPLKVALLKWYKANVITAFPVGVEPTAIAFDGANIWVGNNVSATVNKLRANDGAPLGTFSVWDPNGLCFDGANIWVSSYHLGFGGRGAAELKPDDKKPMGMDNTVTKLRASDGKVLGTFNTGVAPGWPTFDGEYIWIPNGGDNTVSKMRARDGLVVGTFSVGASPMATAFDGENVWVTNFTGISGPGSVTKLRASDGTVLGTFTVGHGPFGIAFDGANMWVANANDGTVTKLRSSDGTILGTFNTYGATGVAFDGLSIWVSGVPGLHELRASDGKLLLSLVQPGNASVPIAFDGANIWVGLSNVAAVGKL